MFSEALPVHPISPDAINIYLASEAKKYSTSREAFNGRNSVVENDRSKVPGAGPKGPNVGVVAISEVDRSKGASSAVELTNRRAARAIDRPIRRLAVVNNRKAHFKVSGLGIDDSTCRDGRSVS